MMILCPTARFSRFEKGEAKDIMISKDHLAIVESGRVADEALMQMAKKHTGKIFICDEEGRVVGLISKTDYWMPQASARNSSSIQTGFQG